VRNEPGPDTDAGPGRERDSVQQGAHYFHEQPAVGDDRVLVPVRLAGREVEVVTAPGVFSAERLDLGTRVLLREAPPPPASGDLLDLGCGWGPLALSLALLSPRATVWAVDVNERALDLTRENARRLGGAGVRAVRPDDVPDDVRFAAIWSNPPIRIGKEALHALLLRWLPRLRPGAQAHLVVQRHLGADSLHAWLTARLPGSAVVERAGSAKGYRVLRITARPDS
jgi:16S rRNA (guanine1207-N2)-methyltransferase